MTDDVSPDFLSLAPDLPDPCSEQDFQLAR